MATIQKKTVLITGCSTGGLGWALAKAFHARGFHVFATARDPSTAADLLAPQPGEEGEEDVEVLALDVTVPDAVARCRDAVAKRAGGRLDVLVNNAGVEFASPLLDVDIAEARKLYDVNVWGPLAVVQAFAPLLVEAKGVVVNQSSIDAVLSMAWAGIFNSSKAAAARMSETLKLELEPLGVRVVTVMCGSADTPMFGKPGGRMRLPATSYYGGVEDAAYRERTGHRSKAMKVELLADELVGDVLGGARGPIWHGAFASITRFSTWAFPTWYVDKLVNAERGLDKVRRC
ncbi:hypothetical protein Hte_005674 [Hypoxylon texense]